MVQVGVQRRSQGRAVMDQPGPRMTPAMDSPGMAFGLAKPPFEIQVVLGRIVLIPHKQPGKKAAHEPRHVPGKWVFLSGESSLEFPKFATTILLRAFGRIEGVSNGLDLFHLRAQFLLIVFHGLQSPVDACG